MNDLDVYEHETDAFTPRRAPSSTTKPPSTAAA